MLDAVNANDPAATLLVHRVPAFNDNYLWLIQARDSKSVYAVDPGDAKPIMQYLAEQGLELAGILVTHHHNDHVGGIDTLTATWPVPVMGPATERFSSIVTSPVGEGDSFMLFDRFSVEILGLPGHTVDHIGYLLAPGGQAPMLFCGDTLFGGGCGRLFEGSPQSMFDSLQKLAQLDDDTQIFCAHEYTLANLKFAVAVEPQNSQLQQRLTDVKALRSRDEATIPSTIGLEKETNPFLRSHKELVAEAVSEHVAQQLTNPVQVFAATRQWKDNF